MRCLIIDVAGDFILRDEVVKMMQEYFGDK